jgi:hypothetical protein
MGEEFNIYNLRLKGIVRLLFAVYRLPLKLPALTTKNLLTAP